MVREEGRSFLADGKKAILLKRVFRTEARTGGRESPSKGGLLWGAPGEKAQPGEEGGDVLLSREKEELFSQKRLLFV